MKAEVLTWAGWEPLQKKAWPHVAPGGCPSLALKLASLLDTFLVFGQFSELLSGLGSQQPVLMLGEC